MTEVTNGICRVLTCLISTGLSTLPFESVAIYLSTWMSDLPLLSYFCMLFCEDYLRRGQGYDTPDWL